MGGELDDVLLLGRELGALPHPGLALLQFVEGDIEGAAAAIAGAVAGPKISSTGRRCSPRRSRSPLRRAHYVSDSAASSAEAS